MARAADHTIDAGRAAPPGLTHTAYVKIGVILSRADMIRATQDDNLRDGTPCAAGEIQ